MNAHTSAMMARILYAMWLDEIESQPDLIRSGVPAYATIDPTIQTQRTELADEKGPNSRLYVFCYTNPPAGRKAPRCRHLSGGARRADRTLGASGVHRRVRQSRREGLRDRRGILQAVELGAVEEQDGARQALL